DGQEVKWQTARQHTFDIPFLCGDITPRALRVPEGEARRHANGRKGIAKVSVAVHDVDASLRRYEALLGKLESTADGGIRVGECVIELVRKDRARGEGPD